MALCAFPPSFPVSLRPQHTCAVLYQVPLIAAETPSSLAYLTRVSCLTVILLNSLFAVAWAEESLTLASLFLFGPAARALMQFSGPTAWPLPRTISVHKAVRLIV